MGRDRAPAVVFVPGFMQRGEAWRPVAERLGERYRSVCLDPRGSTFEARLEEILTGTPRGAALVGYSLGARLALHAALHEPDRLAALVLVGGNAGIEDDAARGARRSFDEALAAWMEGRPIDEIVSRWEWSPIFASQSRKLRGAQRAARLSHDPGELASLLRTAGQGVVPPVWHRMGEIACPALAVAGELDRKYADAAARMAKLMPAARVRLIPGTGHAPQLEAPERFATALDEFLDEHLAQGGLVGGDSEPRALGDGQ